MNALNRALIYLARRSERVNPAALHKTFVDVGPLSTLLRSHDHQVIFGRRGTGKTHALHYHAHQVRASEDCAIYLDMRTLGSTSGLYADQAIPLAERGTRLLVDVLAALHDGLIDFALDPPFTRQEAIDSSLPLIDALGDELTRISVDGPVEHEQVTENTLTAQTSAGVSLTAGATVGLSVAAQSGDSLTDRTQHRILMSGTAAHRVNFGGVTKSLQRVLDAFSPHHVWVLLDEWSVIPLELQPLLADFVRRALLPLLGLTVKISAIEHRAVFRLGGARGAYIGMEIGSDIAADVNLDDFLVFEHNAEMTQAFYRRLIFGHVREASLADPELVVPDTAHELMHAMFTQAAALTEVGRAAQGVPRDAINILVLAAQGASERKISVRDVQLAARKYYERDKETPITGHPEAKSLWPQLVKRVVAQQRSSAFAVDQEEAATSETLAWLYDQRLVHLIRRGVISHVDVDTRFDIYALDYGCYSHRTTYRPKGLFPYVDKDGTLRYATIPREEYDSLAPAIVKLSGN